jgi:integrase
MHLASIADSARHIEQLDPYIGHLPLDHIHDGTLEPFKQARRAAGRKAKSINLALQVVRRVLNLAARKWRDGNVSWLETAPLLSMEPLIDQRKPYPLSFEEQGELLQALPEHLAGMALYKVNTGLRQQEVCWLNWGWETRVPGIGSVFVLPGAPEPVTGWPGVKNRQDRVVVHNETAAGVIEAQRGKHETWVFPYRGRRVTRMNDTAWRRAKDKVGLPVRVHDLKHTFGRRLRSAGVALETRKVLLGHSNGDITVHYSQPELRELLRAVRRLDQARRDNVVLLRVGQNSGTQMANGRS